MSEIKHSSNNEFIVDRSAMNSPSSSPSNMSRSTTMSDFLHCPNCHYPISQAERDKRLSHSPDQIDSSLMDESLGRTAARAVTMNVPFGQYDQTQYLSDPYARHIKPESSFMKAKPLFSFSLPKRLKRMPRNERTSPPRRPVRPSPAQCPPFILGLSSLKSSISAPFVSAKQQAQGIVQGSMSKDINLAYRPAAKTIQKTSRDPFISSSSLDIGDASTNARTAHSIVPGLEDVGARSTSTPDDPLLYSTPPTTASKIALQPSPLHLDQYAPPIPPNKPRMRTPFQSESFEYAPQISSSRILERGSHVSSPSIYSDRTSSSLSPLLDTPPTSPPPLPKRNASRNTVTSEQAEKAACRMRSELGMMESATQMSLVSQKFSRRQSNTRLQPDVHESNNEVHISTKDIPLPSSDYSEDNPILDAIKEAICRNPVLQAWLLSRQAAADKIPEGLNGRLPTSRRSSHASSAATASSEAMPPSLRKIPDPGPPPTASHQGSSAVVSEPSPTQAHRQSRGSASPTSLLQMRQKLYELSDDGSSDHGESNSDSPPASLLKGSRSSTSTVELPLNCRKIEIELKGRKVPILIHENGKIYESPCTEPSCSQHGRSTADVKL